MTEHDGTGHVVNAGGAPSACGGPAKCPHCARNAAKHLRKSDGGVNTFGPLVWEAIANLIEAMGNIQKQINPPLAIVGDVGVYAGDITWVADPEAGRAAWDAKVDERYERERKARDARVDAAVRRGGVPNADDITSLLAEANPKSEDWFVHRIEILTQERDAARRQNADLQAANNALLERALSAEAKTAVLGALKNE